MGGEYPRNKGESFMKLIMDSVMIFYMLIFSYALGRKRSDGSNVVPIYVTAMAIIFVLAVFLILNIPSILELMQNYGG